MCAEDYSFFDSLQMLRDTLSVRVLGYIKNYWMHVKRPSLQCNLVNVKVRLHVHFPAYYDAAIYEDRSLYASVVAKKKPEVKIDLRKMLAGKSI